MTHIQENYKNFNPHPKTLKSVERIVASIPSKRLAGLNTIILTNTKALNNKKRRQKTKSRKRKVALNNCLGWYIQKWDRNPAYIELLIDNIYQGYPKWVHFFNFIHDLPIASTLFHEVGHHIHKTQAPEFNDKEDVANKWGRKLYRKYCMNRYWYIIIPLYPVIYISNRLYKK
ncbi:hypothetical protein K8R14_01690 [bacterium]|nr:hypothetical protein [bacterium]